MWRRLFDTMERRGIPYCTVLGNHDAEQDLTRAEIGRLAASGPHSLNTTGVSGELSDLELEVLGRDSGAPPCCSTASIRTPNRRRRASKATTGPAGADRPGCGRAAKPARRPTAAVRCPRWPFFHIALPEYAAAWRNPDNSRIGRRRPRTSAPGALNPGMFAALVETGSVMATFAGHDHDIDYLAATGESVSATAASRATTPHTTTCGPACGLLVLTEGERGFETWIREDDGRKVDHARFADGRITEIPAKR